MMLKEESKKQLITRATQYGVDPSQCMIVLTGRIYLCSHAEIQGYSRYPLLYQLH